MDMLNNLELNLEEFKRIFNDISNIEKDFSDENLAHFLLHNLLESYYEVKTRLKYERDKIFLEQVVFHIRTQIWD